MVGVAATAVSTNASLLSLLPESTESLILRIFDGTVQNGRTNSDTHRRRKGPPPQERKSDAQMRTVVSGYVFTVKLLIPRINLTAYL